MGIRILIKYYLVNGRKCILLKNFTLTVTAKADIPKEREIYIYIYSTTSHAARRRRNVPIEPRALIFQPDVRKRRSYGALNR